MSQPAAQPSEASRSESGPGRRLGAGLLIATLGVVYGDIGTSPLYAFREALGPARTDNILLAEEVLGTASLILWALFLIVTLWHY